MATSWRSLSRLGGAGSDLATGPADLRTAWAPAHNERPRRSAGPLARFRCPIAGSAWWGQLTLYRSTGLQMLFAFAGVGLTIERTYQAPLVENLHVYRASPRLLMSTSCFAKSLHVPLICR